MSQRSIVNLQNKIACSFQPIDDNHSNVMCDVDGELEGNA